MTETRDEWIKKRAYALWEEEGRPTGRDAIHWEKAGGERDALDAASKAGNGKVAKPRAKKAAGPKAATRETATTKTVAPKTLAEISKNDEAKAPVKRKTTTTQASGIVTPKPKPTTSRKSAS